MVRKPDGSTRTGGVKAYTENQPTNGHGDMNKKASGGGRGWSERGKEGSFQNNPTDGGKKETQNTWRHNK